MISRARRILNQALLCGAIALAGCGDDDDPAAPEKPDTDPRIVFNSRRGGEAHLYSMKLDGSDVQQITTVDGTVFETLDKDMNVLDASTVAETAPTSTRPIWPKASNIPG